MPSKPPTDEWLAAALRSIGDAIVTIDSLSRITWMNEAAEAMTGASLGRSQNLPLADVLPLYDEAGSLAATSPVPGTAAYTFRRAGVADRPLEVSCFRLTSGHILICRDFTANRDRLDAIAGLAGGVAHDLNNQLTVIQGYANELRNMPGLEDQTPVFEIAAASLAAATMTRSLLRIARCSSNRPEALILSNVVAEMRSEIAGILGSTRTLRVFENPTGPTVQADRALLQQILTAIAAFSHDANPPGGEFLIEAGGTVPGWNGAGSYARLWIDTGAGLGQQSISRIFEPLCTSRPVGFATGFGLAEVYGMVTQCGGFIRAATGSNGNVGFEILLPNGSAAVRPQAEEPHPTVLLVDDDASVRRIAHKYIERAGFHLIEASNAEEAVDLAMGHGDPIHMLVTDVVLPGMNGRELADKLRIGRPDLKVLLVSGFPRNTLVHTGGQGLRFLPKPFSADQLLDGIRGLVQEEAVPAQTL